MRLLRHSFRTGFRPFTRQLLPAVAKRFSSEGTDSHQFDFRVSRLGLVPKWISPSLATILQLPEVESAVDVLKGKTKASPTLESDLERASQVLESMSPGGNEHLASLALRAELQQRMGKHKASHQSICDLEGLLKDNEKSGQPLTEASVELTLAKAKSAWYKGDFGTTEQCCDNMLEKDGIEDMPLHFASALTGRGMAKFLQCGNLDGAFTVRDPCRMALKCIEHYKPLYGSALIAAHLNMGVAEVVYANVVGNERGVTVPIDPALKKWMEGITVLEGLTPRSPIGKAIMAALEVRLELNMAWGILKIDDGMEDIVPEASEHAGNALSCSDKLTSIENDDKEYLRRILSVVANCYHKAGKAVTAEGLLQSATSLPSIGCTLTKLDERNAFGSYAALCKDWDKREGDADRMRSKAEDIDKALPTPWQGKDGILSSLWFWTPGEFQY